MKKIAVMGYGTVGSGVVKILEENKDLITKRTKEEFIVKYILDIKNFPNDKYQDKIIKDFNIILNDPEIDIVCEVIGGVSTAYTYTKKLLENKKAVVTSNKELVATKGYELLKIAKENNTKYLFEAAVGGGIPLIQTVINSLVANNTLEVIGILNGTTNYILTKMVKDNISFKEALENAQKLGYAEANPDNDILGYDTGKKISILASLALGEWVNPDCVYTKGIQDLNLEDIKKANLEGYTVKLIGYFKKVKDNKIKIFVAPCLIKKDQMLALVEDVYNEIIIKGDMVGDLAFYGMGAGSLTTASSVCGDIVSCTLKTIVPEIKKETSYKIEKIDFQYLEGTNLPILK